MANALRGSMDAAEYKHVVLGLIFLKYLSGAFEEYHAKLAAEQAQGADPEDPNAYRAVNVFWVPPEARWAHLKAQAPQPSIGQLVDDAMAGIEREYEGGRRANVSEKVSFFVEKTDKGVRLMVEGQPKIEEVIPLASVKEPNNKVASGYTDKPVGPREEVGTRAAPSRTASAPCSELNPPVRPGRRYDRAFLRQEAGGQASRRNH